LTDLIKFSKLATGKIALDKMKWR